MPPIVIVMIFVGASAILFLALMTLDRRKSQARLLRERLEAIDEAAARNPSEELVILRDELLSGIPALNRLISHSSRLATIQPWLNQSGLKIRAGKFLLVCVAAGVLFASLAWNIGQTPWLALVGFPLGAAIPCLYVATVRNRRFKRFDVLFPEAIDLLARAVRAGHAFTTALELIATDVAEPVAGEFRKAFEEQKFGLPIRDALMNLAGRVPSVDVKVFVTALLLQRETGGNLADILDKLSYIIRERFKILRQVRVFTAQGRLTLAMLMALPPGCVAIMMFLNPDFMRPLLTDPIGHFLIGAAVTSQTIGYFVIRKIIRIKV